MAAPDLLSLVLTLRPLQALATPPSLGRAAHAILLDAVRRSDAELATRLHDESGVKPFTTSSLIGLRLREGLRPERTHALRFTALTGAVARALGQAAGLPWAADESPPEAPLAVGAVLNLAGALLRIERVDSAEPDAGPAHPWAAQTTYEALSAPWLLGRVRPGRRLSLAFMSPTTFKSAGKHVPVPLPEWVFGSLLEKWNAFAPVALPDEVRRFAAEVLALSRYDLHTLGLPLKEEAVRIGAVGQATYTALHEDRYWLSLIHLLADFALYAGVGAGAGMGFGQTRRLIDGEDRRQPARANSGAAVVDEGGSPTS